MALTITKPNPNAKLMAMIRNLHKQGLLDSPSYRQTLKDEATKLRISDEKLERLIAEVKETSVSSENKTEQEEVTEAKNKIEDETLSMPSLPSKKQITPYIIGAAIALVVICFFVFKICLNDNTKSDSSATIETLPPNPVDNHLQQLIQDGEDIFKNKNIARAKAMFVKALTEYPDNEGIKQRIAECNKILRQSNYMNLLQARENGKLGFADKDGYIVIDFLYDQEVERKSEMILLKTGDKFGVVGGAEKDCSSTKYVKAEWIAEELSYRMLKNQTGDCDFVHVVDGKLNVDEY